MGVVYVLPKAGTNFLSNLLKELNIQDECFHFIANEPKNKSFLETHSEAFFRNPSLNEKKVVLIRDLKDVMVSAQFWINKWLNEYSSSISPQEKKYISSSPDSQLLQCIQITKSAKNHMGFTVAALDLILSIINHPNTFIVKFEDIIGKSNGGDLEESDQLQKLQDMCQFLGYERSKEQIQKAIQKIWGNSMTFNPIKNKVGRWKTSFKAEHITEFKRFNWDRLNVQLGYPSLDDSQLNSKNE